MAELHKEENSHDCIIDLACASLPQLVLAQSDMLFLIGTTASIPTWNFYLLRPASGLCLRGSPGLFDGLPPPPAGRLGLGCAGRRRWTSDGRLLLLAAARSSTAPRFLLNPTPVRLKGDDLGWQQADPVLQWVTAQWDFLRSGSSFSLTRSPGGTWVSW